MENFLQRNKESFSSLSEMKQCPYRYRLHYVDKYYKQQNSVALKIGSICHKVLELQRAPNIETPPLEELFNILENGFMETKEEDATYEHKIVGTKEIQEEFFEDYIFINEKSGLNYIQKMENFKKYLANYKEDEKWKTIATEFPFEFEYRGFLLNGQIDRLDMDKDGNYKVTDYKTANMVYEDKDLKTPLQMYVYALAVQQAFGKLPVEFEYDFVVLNEKRQAMSKGWEKRGQRMLDNLIDDRQNYYNIKDFPAKPSALCYWCPYREEECQYYSLWKPDNKTYEVNQEYEPFCEVHPHEKHTFVW